MSKNGHAVALNPLAAAAIAQAGPPRPQQQIVRPLLMSDTQCLCLMASIKGGDAGDAIDWSINALARAAIAIKNDAIGKEIERITRESFNVSANESQRVETGSSG